MKRVVIGLMLISLVSLVSSIPLEKEYLCNVTYYGITENKTNMEMINQIIDEKKYGITEDWIIYYTSNWEKICSEKIMRTLKSRLLCEKIYFFILDKNYKYSTEEFNNLAKNVGVSNDVARDYLLNNYEKCVSLGYSAELPKEEIPVLVVYKSKPIECNYEVSPIFRLSIPFPDINLGYKSCDSLNYWKYFFKIEFKDYTITDIRILPLFLLILLILFVLIVRQNRTINKSIETVSYLNQRRVR